MYSQQRSENPIRRKLKFSHSRISNFKFPTAKSKNNSNYSVFAKPIKSVFVTIMATLLFVGFVMGAYCIEGSINVGFKPDFQNKQSSYSSDNALFDKYDNAIAVNISVRGGKEYKVYSPIVTVGELINKLSISLDKNDVISVPEDEYIYDNMFLSIDNIETNTRTETITIPYTTRTVELQTVPKGTERITQSGVNGSSVATVTEKYINGELVETQTIVDEASSVPAVEEVIEKGVGGVYTDKNGNSYEYSYYIDVTATAYGTCSGITATGKRVDYGMIAVDPRVIPLGTKVYLTGSWGDMGVHAAEDTGGAIKGNKIDVFLGDDYNLLRQFGRRSMRVYILA